MARKNLLKGLMGDSPAAPAPSAETAPPSPSPSQRPAKGAKGAIGAVGRSIADLKSRSVTELDPQQIEAGGVVDRLEHDVAEHDRLMTSIRTYGQQVPVLVRPHPEKAGRYQIVYGRRRVLALRDLGQPVKAMIRDLDDEALVLAQGQENTARKDLSFIEKANFARQMRDGGYDRKVICDALNIDKTVISRMLTIIDRVPLEAIEAIGAAPGIGRDRWMVMADLFEKTGWTGREAAVLAHGPTSDERFEAVVMAMTLPQRSRRESRKANPDRTQLSGAGGAPLGAVTREPTRVTLRLDRRKTAGFEDWLVENIEEIHRDWLQRQGGE